MPDWFYVNRLVGSAFLTTAGPRMRTVQEWQRNPIPLQEQTLQDFVRAAANTRFGREHHFSEIQSLKDYQSRVPLRTYLDFKPWWDRLFQGEMDVTWPGRIRFFAITSGTTAGNKLIPLSRQGVRCQQRAGRDILNFYLTQTRNVAFFRGKFLFLGGSTHLVPHPHGALVGDLSGIMTRNMPAYTRLFRLPGQVTAFLTDWEKKLEAMADESWQADLRGISGTPSWLVCLFERVLRRQREAGRPADTLADVWPNLSLLVHGGVSFEPYRKTFKELFDKDLHTMEVYPASEGFIAIQDQFGSNDLLLMMDTGLFYEFVPANELNDPQPRRFTVANIEKGVDYAIVLTTNSGLWSYILGDTVRFTSLRPHRLRITGRTGHFLSAFGEHLIVEEVETAMTDACRETDAEIRDFHVAPLFPTAEDMRPAHQWLVEFLKEPADLKLFIAHLDRSLQRQNDDYAAHRQGDAGMRPPEIAVLRKGAFYETMKTLGKLGGQNKVPRLRNDREFAEALLSSNG